MEKSIKPNLEKLVPGESLEFSIERISSVKNACYLLNAKNFLKGRKWGTTLKRGEGLIIVTRLS